MEGSKEPSCWPKTCVWSSRFDQRQLKWILWGKAVLSTAGLVAHPMHCSLRREVTQGLGPQPASILLCLCFQPRGLCSETSLSGALSHGREQVLLLRPPYRGLGGKPWRCFSPLTQYPVLLSLPCYPSPSLSTMAVRTLVLGSFSRETFSTSAVTHRRKQSFGGASTSSSCLYYHSEW